MKRRTARLLSALLALCMVLVMLPGMALASVDDGQVDLKPANELRWIDRVELPDYALTLYETLEEAADGNGYKDYLIDDEYYDLEGENIRTDVPGEFMRGTVTFSNGSATRYTAILVTTTETDKTDQNTKDYIANCIRTVVSAFKFDHQEVFWINGVYRIEFNRNGTRYFCLALCANNREPDAENAAYYEIRRPDFRTDGQWDVRRAMARRDADIEKILDTIPVGADRFMQTYYLNKWLAENNQYNITVEKDGDGPWYAYECISALEGLGGADGPVCSGYAGAFKVLCDKLGIPCVTVIGQVAENTGHRWNYVQMEDGKWYAVDVTKDDRNDNSANLTKWLLTGGKTVVNGKEFLETHPAHNRSYYAGGTNFTNGPVLSDDAYPRSVHLAYTGLPEKPGDSVAMTPVLIFDSGAAYIYSCTELPAGLTLNPNTGAITGSVTDDMDEHTVTVTAANPDNPADTACCTLQLTVDDDTGTPALPFTDVSTDAYYYGAAAWAVAQGVTKGTSGMTFSPGDSVTRGQAVTFLWRAAGEPAPKSENPFSDVPANEFYTDAVLWAVENGITSGVGGGMFSPNSSVTNAQMLTFISRAMGEVVHGSGWQQAALDWASENGLLEGLPTAPDIEENCPRSDVVFFLWRIYA